MPVIAKLIHGNSPSKPFGGRDAYIIEESGGVVTIRKERSSPLTASETIKIGDATLTVEAP